MPNTSHAPTDGISPERSASMRGRLCIVLAALLWSSGGFFVKSPLFHDWPPETRGLALAFWRALFAGLVLVPLVRRPRWAWTMLPMTLCFVLMNITYLSAMVWTTAANAIWLQYLAPLWVAVIGVLLLREPLPRKDIVLLACGLGGVGTILFFEVRGQQMAGVICGMLSGVFFGSIVLFLRGLRDHDGAWMMCLNLFSTAAALAPWMWLNGPAPSAYQLPWLAAFGVFQLGLPYYLFSRGLRSVASPEASGISLLEPILLPVWVYLRWDEAPAPWTIVGGTLIFVGLVLRYMGSAWRR